MAKGFRKPSHPIFYLLIYHRGGRDENLKNYLVWPYGPIELFAGRTPHVVDFVVVVVVVVHRLIFKLQ